MIAFYYKEMEGVESYNLQLRRKIHELVRRREHEVCHEQLGRGELVGHQHSQQMAHKENEDEKREETGVPGMDESQKEMVGRSEKNIQRMMKQLGMLIMVVVECKLAEREN